MDVKFPDVPATAEEVAALDAALGPVGHDAQWEREHGGFRQGIERRHLLLGALHALQDRVGHLSEGGLGELCRRLDVAPAEAYGVASFYAMFSLSPVPPRTVHVCEDLACAMRGAADLHAEASTDAARVVASPCLGLCERAPAVLVVEAGDPAREAVLAPATAEVVRAAVAGGRLDALPPESSVTIPQRVPFGVTPPESSVTQPPAGTTSTTLPESSVTQPPAGTISTTPPESSVTQPPAELDDPNPSLTIHDESRSASDPGETSLTIRQGAPGGPPGLVLLRRVGVVEPTSLDDYRRTGGYDALHRAIAIGPARVVEEVTTSGLVGRGGAAFPAGRKWAAVAAQPVRPHYLVCNADESEPGTFKDRLLLEGDPFAIVEAMTIAAYATGCERGYVYLRGEYPRARHTLAAAVDTARRHGLLGDDVLGAGFRFDIEIVRGAGAYICGEETAIFNSIEGFRGEPRSKPPFPVEVGLFGKPTLVNNVETLANVPTIVLGGGAAFAATGSGTSTGTKLFCLSGAVTTPGVYEVPFGTTLRDLLGMAGGVAGGRALRAVLLGGAAGAFVGPDQLDVPLTFEGTRAIGATLGSGVVLVIDDATPIPPLLRRIAAFFRDESCGQCVPCRVGTVRQEETLVRLTTGTARPGDLALLREIGQVMRDASICGLGQTAWNAIESAIDGLGVTL